LFANSENSYLELISELLFELQHRRMSEIRIEDMVVLLAFHIKSELNADKNFSEFIHLFEKFAAKNSDTIDAEQITLIIKLMMV
jgi:hypothetical protein